VTCVLAYLQVVSFPKYFDISLSNYTGPRFAFIKARKPLIAQKYRLSSILVKSDAEFSESIMQASMSTFNPFLPSTAHQ
jgi:mTERF